MPKILPDVQRLLARLSTGVVPEAKELALRLSPREREVLSLVARGHSNRAIADKLRISVRTVESHRDHIADKLGLRGAAALTRFAIASGLA